MTSKLKCPYCSADLESTTGGWEYGCTNTECQSAGTLCGTEELWQALIQAKQDLEIATKALSEIESTEWYDSMSSYEIMTFTAMKALKQIEHKE